MIIFPYISISILKLFKAFMHTLTSKKKTCVSGYTQATKLDYF